ncbi:hypothetical protein LCGC14_0715200 [marine sediment metagenome]|uniref:Uncharacterized protein n=1 Tax=marine sediment metagenome TaxID=412755 RepID=A0A0F9SZC3_9ZZZZ
MNNSIQLKLIATHLLAQREENPARSNFPKELVCSGQLILATVLESWYLTSDSFGAKPAL